MAKKLGIIGSGQVAKALAKGFTQVGYQVQVGSRSPEKIHIWPQELGDNLEAGTFEETASFGEIIDWLFSGKVLKMQLIFAVLAIFQASSLLT
jgi:8-hydroxy-5-deazaflavin:NADPH oxidoreductase